MLYLFMAFSSFLFMVCPLTNRRKTGGKAEVFFEKSENIFSGIFQAAQAAKRRAWGGNPNKIPIGQNERLAKFGTVVESCSKKLRPVVCTLTIQLFRAGLLRSGENFLENFSAALYGQAANLPNSRLDFLRKLPLNPYNTTLCDFAKGFIKS